VISWAKSFREARRAMPKGLIFLLVMIAVIIVYTIAKVVRYVRLSEQQWKEVDKSKLKEWKDDEW
jgi:hypothetical protein